MEWIDINVQAPEKGQRVMCEVKIMVNGRVVETQEVKGTYEGFKEPIGHRWDIDVDYKGRGALDFSPKVVSWMPVADDKLEPCPFCGSIPEFKKITVNFNPESIDGFQIICSCGIMTKNKIYHYDGKTEDELKSKLAAIWNKRVDS